MEERELWGLSLFSHGFPDLKQKIQKIPSQSLPISLPLSLSAATGWRTRAAARGTATRSSAQAAREARRPRARAARPRGGGRAAPRATKSGGGSG